MANRSIRSRKLHTNILVEHVIKITKRLPYFLEVRTLSEYRSAEAAIMSCHCLWREGQRRYPQNDSVITREGYLPLFLVIRSGRHGYLELCSRKDRFHVRLLGAEDCPVEITNAVFLSVRQNNFE